MFEFYATIPHQHIRRDMPGHIKYLLSASSSYARAGRLALPVSTKQIHALDCGGYVAARKWKRYPFSIPQYLAWVAQFPALEWFAAFDYCCEPAIATDDYAICLRQENTTRALEQFISALDDWRWCIPAAALIPTVQGWHVQDYERHAIELKPMIDALKHQPHFRVGIGTLCIRASDDMISDVVSAVSAILPDVKFHLWGVKLSALRKIDLSRIASSDSAAWDLGGLPAGKKMNDKRRAMGKTQSAYRFENALPEYIRQLEGLHQLVSLSYGDA